MTEEFKGSVARSKEFYLRPSEINWVQQVFLSVQGRIPDHGVRGRKAICESTAVPATTSVGKRTQ